MLFGVTVGVVCIRDTAVVAGLVVIHVYCVVVVGVTVVVMRGVVGGVVVVVAVAAHRVVVLQSYHAYNHFHVFLVYTHTTCLIYVQQH